MPAVRENVVYTGSVTDRDDMLLYEAPQIRWTFQEPRKIDMGESIVYDEIVR